MYNAEKADRNGTKWFRCWSVDVDRIMKMKGLGTAWAGFCAEKEIFQTE